MPLLIPRTKPKPKKYCDDDLVVLKPEDRHKFSDFLGGLSHNPHVALLDVIRWIRANLEILQVFTIDEIRNEI